MGSVDKIFIFVSIGIAIAAVGLVAGFNSTQTTDTMTRPDTTIQQQAFDPKLMREPLKIKPGTMSSKEALSAKPFEKSTVRELIPRPQGDTGSSGLPCVDCVDSLSIASNAVGASEIASNAVGASEIAANAVGASEMNYSIKSYSVSNNGGSKYVEKRMVANNGKNFCMLIKVKMENVDSGDETAECDIDYGGKSRWLLQAILGEPNNDANVSCQAICIRYP